MPFKDYQKLYEESLENAKALWELADDSLKAKLGTIFPQLLETEDDKMFKAIIEYMEEDIAFYNDMKNGEYDERNAMDKKEHAWLIRARDWLKNLKLELEDKKIYIPKFRPGDFVTSTNNRHLSYIITGIGALNVENKPCYSVDIFQDNIYRANNIIPITVMDEWGELGETVTIGDDGKWKPTMDQIGLVTRVCSNLHMKASDDAEAMDKFLTELECLYFRPGKCLAHKEEEATEEPTTTAPTSYGKRVEALMDKALEKFNHGFSFADAFYAGMETQRTLDKEDAKNKV